MAGTKGKITKAQGGKQKSVYFSDAFGVWPEGKGLHITNLRGEQEFHTNITKNDGLLYDVMLMLYHYGKSLP